MVDHGVVHHATRIAPGKVVMTDNLTIPAAAGTTEIVIVHIYLEQDHEIVMKRHHSGKNDGELISFAFVGLYPVICYKTYFNVRKSCAARLKVFLPFSIGLVKERLTRTGLTDQQQLLRGNKLNAVWERFLEIASLHVMPAH